MFSKTEIESEQDSDSFSGIADLFMKHFEYIIPSKKMEMEYIYKLFVLISDIIIKDVELLERAIDVETEDGIIHGNSLPEEIVEKIY